MNIVCFGEALIDFKATGRLAFQGYEGGSPLNVAVAASRLGAAVGFASQLSTDLFGKALREHLEKNGVDASLLLETDAPTTLAFVAERGGDVHFSFIGNGAADTLYDPRPRPELPDTAKFVQFGSISLLKDPTATAITETIAEHRERCHVVFDPNVRPALIPHKGMYLESLAGWLELSHIVKVSTQDLSWLYPDRGAAEIARAWLEKGPGAVIVTDGGEGATLFRKEGALQVPAPKVEIADTVGAGDTFTGALMVALSEHADDLELLSEAVWREVLEFAAAAAALNCTRAGANPPTREEFDAFSRGLGAVEPAPTDARR